MTNNFQSNMQQEEQNFAKKTKRLLLEKKTFAASWALTSFVDSELIENNYNVVQLPKDQWCYSSTQHQWADLRSEFRLGNLSQSISWNWAPLVLPRMYLYKKQFIGHKEYCAGTNTKRTPTFDDYKDTLKNNFFF